jgi:hypothetical protein
MLNGLRDARRLMGVTACGVMGALAGQAAADFPPLEKVTDGYEQRAAVDGSGLYTIWVREKDGQVLAELPAGYEGKNFFVVPTVSAGDAELGVDPVYAQGGGMRHVYWKRIDDTMVLMAPELSVRSNGDAESKAATERIYTDYVVMTAPILTMGPNGQPVIDLDQMLLGGADKFFGGYGRGLQRNLTQVEKAKAFPYNVELTFTLPKRDGQMTSLHYSIGQPPKSPDYQPREADRRVGFFYTYYQDRAKNDGDSQAVRYIERWNLKKRDPNLKMSPPVKPIVYHIEYTTPVRYRRWVRDGILAWNRAFEQVGIVNAIEVRQQDQQTGAYMDIDPEDIRYSFVRWTNANMGYAIGPSHAHPDTGEIFQADIVMDEGFISGWANARLDAELAAQAMAGFDAETIAWLDENPDWDPRYLLASPAERAEVLAYREAVSEGREWAGEIPPTMAVPLMTTSMMVGPSGKPACMCFRNATMSMGLARTAFDIGLFHDGHDHDGHDHGDGHTHAEGEECCGECEAEDVTMLDGMPESFVGPLLRDVVMHEVGHTLGLMHNWKGSTRHTYTEMNNTPENGGIVGERPLLISVMDYAPTNIVVPNDEVEQGDWAANDIGSYDMWAIEYGYTDGDPMEVAKKAADPDHAFMSDEGQSGPDPHAKVWDLGSDTLSYAANRVAFAEKVRAKLIDQVVKDGESWEEARDGFGKSIFAQFGAMNTAAHWIGGAHVNRYKKGDPDAPDPVRPVDVETQREALHFIMKNGFREDAFGVTPEILAKLGSEQWFDEGWNQQPDWPVHDQILGLQSSLMTTLINPTRLRRVLDNEKRVPADQDALTVPELLSTVRGEVWSELSMDRSGGYTERQPMISSFRRNLQREHVNRLVSIATGRGWGGASGATLAMLARHELRELHGAMESLPPNGIDTYSKAHLDDAKERIERALAAEYVRQS